jgi:hypothetical protein
MATQGYHVGEDVVAPRDQSEADLQAKKDIQTGIP